MPVMSYHVAARKLALFVHAGLTPVVLAVMPFQLWAGCGLNRGLTGLAGVAMTDK